MPPPLALFLTLAFVAVLFRRDVKEAPNVTRALWLPFAWLVIACSREVTEWLHIWGIPVPGGTLEGGTPVDRLFYVAMIISGVVVLRRRQVSLAELARSNVWLCVFLAYCFLAVFWSDYPFVSLKRWIKVLGHPIMALIVLTEPDPEEAISRLVKRCSYILVPVSVLFIKYYPHLGRGFSEWTGEGYNMGIATGKNQLGINCLILGYILSWHFLRVLRWEKSKIRTAELRVVGFLLYLNGWLMWMADSKTSLVALVLGTTVLLATGFEWIARRITFYIVSATLVYIVLQSLFGIYEATLRLLGRDPSLTDRKQIWADVLKVDINPIFGTGFESFWLGERLEFMGTLWRFGLNQAHNGYLETYLNLGIVGLLLLLGLLLSIYGQSVRWLSTWRDWGRLRVGLVVGMLVYNWTEAAFKTTHPIFFILYIIAIDYSVSRIPRDSGAHEPDAALPSEPTRGSPALQPAEA